MMKNARESKQTPVKPLKQQNNKVSFIVFLLLIVLTVLICYNGTYHYPFQLDDYVNFVYPNKIHDLSYFTHLSNWLDPVSRPLSLLTLSLNYNLNGNDTTYYHVINLILHILNGLIVFLLTLQISRFFMKKDELRNRQWFAFLTALLFISHPLQIQGVTYIVQRMTSLAALFYMLSVYFYGEGRIRHTERDERKQAIGYYVLTFITLVLAFLSKPNTASLPLMYVLYEVCFIRNKEDKPYWKYIIGYLGLMIIGFIAIVIMGKLPRETDTISRIDYLMTQFKVLVQYVQMLLVPVGMNIDHDVSVAHKLTFYVGLCFLLIPLLITRAVLSFRKNPLITFAIGWFLIALSIESSIIPIRDVMFEHRLYISILGFALILVYLLWKYLAPKNNTAYKVILLLIVVLWSGLTIARNKVWQTEESLWQDAALKAPNKNRIHRMLGDIYLKENRFDEAYEKYAFSIKLDPRDPETYINMGALREKMQRYEEAWSYYTTAYKMNPNNPVLIYNMGHAAMQMNQNQLAMSYFERVIKEFPNHKEAYNTMGSIYEKEMKYDLASSCYLKAMDDPNTALKANLNLGIMYVSRDMGREAIPYLLKAAKMNPSDVSVAFHLGTAYMMENQMGKAKEFWLKAIEIDPGYTAALNNLGIVEYDANQYAVAVEYWEKSLGYNIKQGNIYPLVIDAYRKLGNTEREKYFLQKAAELGYSTKL